MKNKIAELFDIPHDVVYLNCASLSPQLKSVTVAGSLAVHQKVHPWQIQTDDWFANPEGLRGLAAQVINADTDGMAIIPSVSYGISIAAANVRVAKGQQILVMDKEYPSNYYSWNELAKTNGAEILTVKKESTWTESILNALTDRVAVVAVSNCHWTNGALVDLVKIGEKARLVGAALVVDASQAMGAYPIDIQAVQPDFLVSVGYKWLLGPYGLGYLYAAPKYRETGRPIEHSWLTKNNSEDFAGLVNYRDDFRPGARRFDMGEFSGFINVPMAIAALTQVLDWGVGNIQSRLSMIIAEIDRRAVELDFGFPDADERVGHMIGIDLPGGVSDKLKAALKNENIFVGYRGESIRISPYLYTTTQDIERLFNILKNLR
ncbi:aminotransferase class V-fold PLP-dependent enzyme [Mucilaginibacter sp. L3T2-6]|uniref:aminotransferase class V-fold PLP-dependent enzyme n=1 Tax=Mucilaginibacter sp. L3T2-6 TaxID=3062491 RepID=UPI0026765AF9|nr:aminotransferase class V-fold PLP-dependent enzyme [Mucilaginibacter sp. L3T2-6]MDO3642068.1 aminotransferase class V-fold PLP-dependent enzyme [Mucilaginibacter sp. L3T2-6]MDV6214562.1 aminotransferase class V-fold PLP-dependent enzyme [Mucilaginibacter sp. L3T2-6]